jgi:hypothetical protein
MAARLVLTLEVKQDIAEAYLWYQSQRSGLGEEFVRSVEDCLDTIQRRPKLSAPVYQDYRRALVRRFPLLRHLRSRESNRDGLLSYSYGAGSGQMACASS